MTFTWPFMLAGLALLPLLAALHWWVGRRRTRYAYAFTNVDVLRRSIPASSSWRGHVAAGLLLTALAAMIVGLARPERVISVPKKHATILLAIDTSGSMVADDVAPTRLTAATDQAQQFVDGLPDGFEIGLVRFASDAEVVLAPTRNRETVKTALANLQ